MLKLALPGDLDAKYKAALEDWTRNGKVELFWNRDAALWTGEDESKWMGWLDIVDEQLAQIQKLLDLQSEVREKGYKHAVLLGMGGSSLSPEVTAMTFGRQPGYPELLILDSTNPEQIRHLETRFDYRSTVFVVASKSGSTLEPNIFKQYFFTRAKEELGADAPKHFIAITDPGSKMQQVAEQDGFAHIFFGRPSIGGRYSALSNFGMVAAAIAGVDVRKLLDRANGMAQECRKPGGETPGVQLGCVLGALGNAGRDKVTINASAGVSDFGAWMEQLIAESTGKIGKGLIPVDREPIGAPEVYGNDRVFVHLKLATDDTSTADAAFAKLEQGGHPVIRVQLEDVYDIGGQYFLWEVGTAIAGSLLGINPFNQPDVEASKIATRDLTTEYESKGSLPQETPIFSQDDISLFADERNAGLLTPIARSLDGYIAAHIARAKAGDYFALLAYIDMNHETEAALQRGSIAVRDGKHVATCLGVGPRFLPSPGQAYKGCPNSGVLLQVTLDLPQDVQVPGQKYTFGVVQNAQARGDFQVLSERKRRALRVHIACHLMHGLGRLNKAISNALQKGH